MSSLCCVARQRGRKAMLPNWRMGPLIGIRLTILSVTGLIQYNKGYGNFVGPRLGLRYVKVSSYSV